VRKGVARSLLGISAFPWVERPSRRSFLRPPFPLAEGIGSGAIIEGGEFNLRLAPLGRSWQNGPVRVWAWKGIEMPKGFPALPGGLPKGILRMEKGEIKIGCCGFPLAREKYFRLFSLVEIQQTFYQLPKYETAGKWRQTAPPGFEFTLKAWQLITHEPTSPTYRRLRRKIPPGHFRRYGSFRPTDEVLEAWDQTLQFARNLGASIVVFQCPASFRPERENIDHMHRFFARIDRGGLRLAWEPRGDWPEDVVRGIAQDLNLIHAVDPFQGRPLYGTLQYFRLHGIGGYGHRYTDGELKKILSWALSDRMTYVLFNNRGMKEDALRLKEFLGP